MYLLVLVTLCAALLQPSMCVDNTEDCIKVHNQYRAGHIGTPSVSYSKAAAVEAQRRVDQLVALGKMDGHAGKSSECISLIDFNGLSNFPLTVM